MSSKESPSSFPISTHSDPFSTFPDQTRIPFSAVNTSSELPAPCTTKKKQPINRRLRSRLRWWFCASTGFLIFSPIVSVLLGLSLHARDFQDKNDGSVYTGRSIVFESILVAADPKLGTVTLDWTIIGEANSSCLKGSRNLTGCSDVNIFFDNNLLRTGQDVGGDDVLSSDRPTKPVFRFNATAYAVTDIIANTPTFRTELALFSAGDPESSLLYYPFDRYSAEILVFAQESSTNETVGIVLGRTRGIAVGFKTIATTRPNVFIPPGVIDIIVTLQRGNLVKTYSIVATIAMWLITLILLLVMVTSVFFGFKQKSEVLVIPVATLFAFTQLRQSMPGAPDGFGDIVDFVGLLPCLALLSLAAAFTLGVFILMDPTEQETQLTRQVLHDAFPTLFRFRGKKDFEGQSSVASSTGD